MGLEIAIPAKCGTTTTCNLCGGHDHRKLFRKFGYDLLRCNGCKLVFVGNPPTGAEVEAFYSAEADYHSELLDPANPAFERMRGIARQHVRMLGRNIARPQGLKLLDIGCSSGLFLDEARKAGYDVHGAELSPDTARFARSHFVLDVQTGDWRDGGFEDASFDVITLFDVIEHVPDPLGELQAIMRLLKPGGVLLQSTPNIDGLFPRLSYLLANRLDYWPHPEPPHHLYQFSVDTLTAMTGAAGYDVSRRDLTSIQLAYSFGTPVSWKVSPKLLAYAMLFAPAAVIGQWIGQGDWLYLAARRPVN